MVTKYISPSGSDSAAGDITTPWLTIQKWMTSAPNAGDTLLCRGGIYLNPPKAYCGYNGVPGLLGTASQPITIKNYPGETPVFSGGTSWLIGIAGDVSPSAYVVIDGLQMKDRTIGSSGYMYTGAWGSQAYYTVDHVTIRNCRVEMKYGDIVNQSHGVYMAHHSRNVLVEDCVFIGAGPSGGGGSGITPGDWNIPTYTPTGIVIQRCIFKDFAAAGIIVWDNTATAYLMDVLISHCSFLNNVTALRIEGHGPTTVVDCASTSIYVAPTSGSGVPWIYHNYNAITDVTQTNNYFSQTFDANYYLDAADSGWKAASDGLDAGALNVSETVPGPGVGLTHAFVSQYEDGSSVGLLQPSHWNAEHTIGELRLLSGIATPEARVTAPQGSIYLRTDGSTSTTLYVKTSGTGNTGWTPK